MFSFPILLGSAAMEAMDTAAIHRLLALLCQAQVHFHHLYTKHKTQNTKHKTQNMLVIYAVLRSFLQKIFNANWNLIGLCIAFAKLWNGENENRCCCFWGRGLTGVRNEFRAIRIRIEEVDTHRCGPWGSWLPLEARLCLLKFPL